MCDIDAALAEKTAADFEVRAFSDVSALLASDAVDAVVIATPAGTHGDIALAALDAGMHVYCEKPVTPTADEGYALAQHARDAQLVFQVGFQFRFHKGYVALRETFADLGPLRRVHVSATNWFRPQAYFDESPWRATWRMAGGGVLMNQAVHQVDALINTVGMPSRVRARVRTAAHRAEVEDEAFALLEWPDGARGTLVASLNDLAGRERFELALRPRQRRARRRLRRKGRALRRRFAAGHRRGCGSVRRRTRSIGRTSRSYPVATTTSR